MVWISFWLVLKTAALAGLLGFVQFLLGMRDNRILGFVIFVPALAALYGSGYLTGSSFAISWSHIGILFAISLVLLAIRGYIIRYLNKERIVTTLP